MAAAGPTTCACACKEEKSSASPSVSDECMAGCCSSATWSWVYPLIKLAKRTVESDVGNNCPRNSGAHPRAPQSHLSTGSPKSIRMTIWRPSPATSASPASSKRYLTRARTRPHRAYL